MVTNYIRPTTFTSITPIPHPPQNTLPHRQTHFGDIIYWKLTQKSFFMWKKSKSEEKNANAHLFKGGWCAAKNHHITANKKDQKLKYEVLIAFKGQISSKSSRLFAFKKQSSFSLHQQGLWCISDTKTCRTTKIGHFLDLKRLDLKRISTFDHIYLF